MSNIILRVGTPTPVECAGRRYNLYQSDDGQLYLEAETGETLKVTVADDGEGSVVAQGTWVNVDIDNQEED